MYTWHAAIDRVELESNTNPNVCTNECFRRNGKRNANIMPLLSSGLFIFHFEWAKNGFRNQLQQYYQQCIHSVQPINAAHPFPKKRRTHMPSFLTLSLALEFLLRFNFLIHVYVLWNVDKIEPKDHFWNYFRTKVNKYKQYFWLTYLWGPSFAYSLTRPHNFYIDISLNLKYHYT